MPPPYRTVAYVNEPPEPGSNRIPAQFPAAGAVALPSAFVSPPTVSSRYDVKAIGCAAVPVAIRFPFTNRNDAVLQLPFVTGRNFTTAPGAIVNVAPDATVTSPLPITYTAPNCPQVTFPVTV